MDNLALYAVFGHPIGHSLSPAMHNQAFSERGMGACYFAVDCTPGELERKLVAFRVLGGRGLNLTRPLKETVLTVVQDHDDWVQSAGAANTLTATSAGWTAANTDCAALFSLLAPHARGGGAAMVLGAGGVARASAAVLHRQGFHVTAYARRPERCDWADEVRPWDERLSKRHWQVVVNATPLGQIGELSMDRWPVPVVGGVAVDWVYRPAETQFLVTAREAGAVIVDGLTLLVEQAAWAWVCWYGEQGPRTVMAEAVSPWR